MLKCMIAPLMSFAIIGAMGNFASINEGKIGWYAIGWYVVTTV
jgi:Na+/H+-dicarboxylate symporter